jgi:hypothetical protein
VQFLQHYLRNMGEIASETPSDRADVSRALRVVVTCSSRKTVPVPSGLRLSTLPQKGARARARAWVARLDSHRAPTLSARELYAGDHWHVAQSLASEADGDLELWVASAGYGLIQESRSIKPYAATFSEGPDTAVSWTPAGGRETALQQWWTLLAESETLAIDAPRSVRSLVAGDPQATLIVALSRAYLLALKDDLVAARRELRGPGKLVLVSAGTKSCPGLEENLVQVGAEVQSALGGSLLSLNVRIVRHLIRTRYEHGWQRGSMATSFRGLRSNRPVADRRTTLNDREVIEFIGRARRDNGDISKTALLRRLRDHGFACEQGRFRELFSQAVVR